MRKLTLLCIVFYLMISCSDNDEVSEASLIGDWQLTEALADPGDGSGEFRPIDSEKNITFRVDGTVTSNGSLCNFSTTAQNGTIGTYSLHTFTISSEQCDNQGDDVAFRLEGQSLIVTYACIEGCAEKYNKSE